MPRLEKKSFDAPDQRVEPAPKIRSDRVNVLGRELRRVTIEPGWTFREHSAPARGTELCEDFHVKLFFAGRFVMAFEDGGQEVYGAGDIGIVDPHHDAWVEGDEPVVFIDLAQFFEASA